MKIHNFEQGTPEWFKVREGKMTASHAQAIGNCGKGLTTYINEMMSEMYSSGEDEKFSNKHTDRGNELEPLARSMYELQNGVKVEQVGFIEYNNYVGCSPDGLVGDVGGVEIKSIQDKDYFLHLISENGSQVESKHIWQVQMNLLITGRQWWDLVYYNPNYKRSMCVYRIYPDPEQFEALKMGFEMGTTMIKNIKDKIENE